MSLTSSIINGNRHYWHGTLNIGQLPFVNWKLQSNGILDRTVLSRNEEKLWVHLVQNEDWTWDQHPTQSLFILHDSVLLKYSLAELFLGQKLCRCKTETLILKRRRSYNPEARRMTKEITPLCQKQAEWGKAMMKLEVGARMMLRKSWSSRKP